MAAIESIPRSAPTRRWEIQLLPEGEDLQHWRHEAMAVAERWGFEEDVTQDVALVVSELLTNVLRHAGDPRCVLELRKVGCTIFIRVSDHDPTLPAIREPDWLASSGRGLWTLRNIVDVLRWFNAPRRSGAGKTVWCQIDARSGGHQ